MYDPSTDTWITTGNMNNGRYWHTASVLLNGKVLVTGGRGNSFLNSVELYDPSTGTWTTTGRMTNTRYYHTASLLSNGKVLVTGGMDNANAYLNSAELYDPSTGTWIATGNMKNARAYHTASVLSNGKVLVTGGGGSSGSGTGSLYSAELYDPSTGTWTTTGNITNARYYHTSSVLSNGKVIITGGSNSNANALNSAELY
ncbi:unnamed protein product [Adineta steineri]|uniref:Uncharacterized protein n=1 Tax=Adineta steineri TaxID=433720 RepID=A0A816FSS4_9BILA|nr:unnamed protein product [Adineta steineri]CAF1665076.1 unnamed protein product [Adineta steineri]